MEYSHICYLSRSVCKEAVDHRPNNYVKAVGSSLVRSNLCTSLIAVSTAVQSSDTKTMSVAQLLRNN